MTTLATAPAVPDSVDALAADGGIVTIRPVRNSDRSALARLHEEASPESLRLRFFGWPTPGMLAAEVNRLCQPDDGRLLAMLALQGGAAVGVASCERADVSDPRAEFSLFVAEHHRGRGIGTLLLEHLAAWARREGIAELLGEVLPGNTLMLRVARDLSARAWSQYGSGVMDVGIRLDGGEDLTDPAVDARDRTAEHASLRAVLAP